MEHSELEGLWKSVYAPPLKDPYVLKGFQKLAVTFLMWCKERYKFAFVADEMGIGKVIAHHNTEHRPLKSSRFCTT